MTNQELVEMVKSLNIHELKLNVMLRKHHSELYNEVVKRTSYLVGDFYKNNVVPMLARLYCLEHDICEQPKCSYSECTHNVKWRSDLKRFATYCSRKCTYDDDCHWDRIKSGCFDHYGVENPTQASEIKERMKATCRDRYGVEYSAASDVVQARIRETNQKIYGVDYPLQVGKILDRTRDTCEQRYGHRCVFNTRHVRDIMTKRFGCEWYTQSMEYHKTRKHKFTSPKYPGVTFDSTWEIKVYDFLMENHIQFEYQVKPIPYEYDGVTHYYHPDFLVNGRIYEVKGDNFFRTNEATGKEEMYLTWQGDLSDEEYEWRCGLLKAKYQCMIANNVTILRNSQIKNLSVDIFATATPLTPNP